LRREVCDFSCCQDSADVTLQGSSSFPTNMELGLAIRSRIEQAGGESCFERRGVE
jgi:hypothetical protein